MSYILKEFSYLTKGQVKVVVPWIEDENSLLYRKHGMLNSGLIVEADEVFSLFTGVVSNVCSDQYGYYVTIEYDANTLVRYCYLKTCSVNQGQLIVFGDPVGTTYKMFRSLSKENTFRFEYCNFQESNMPVRFSRKTYFKHDPVPVLQDEKQYQFDPRTQSVIDTNSYYDPSKQIKNKEFTTQGNGGTVIW